MQRATHAVWCQDIAYTLCQDILYTSVLTDAGKLPFPERMPLAVDPVIPPLENRRLR